MLSFFTFLHEKSETATATEKMEKINSRKRRFSADPSYQKEIRRWQMVAKVCEATDSQTKRCKHGEMTNIAAEFGVDASTLRRLMKSYRIQVAQRKKFIDLAPKNMEKCGRPTNLTPGIRHQIKTANLRTGCKLTIRGLARAIKKQFNYDICSATLHRYLKAMDARTRTSHIKPHLTEAHKLARLNFVRSKIGPEGTFGADKNVIHIDEKWFMLQNTKRRLRIIDGQDPGDETVQHKSHIPKIMFLCAVGVPQQKPNGQWFDGKIGIWEVAKMEPAKNNSRLRPKGTPVLTPVNMTAGVYQHFIAGQGKVIDAIKTKMDWMRGEKIIVQHDGAKPHTAATTVAALQRAGHTDGWDIDFVTQPAQSPDLNKCDLCFFYSLQTRSAELRTDCRKLEDMVQAVKKAYQDYSQEQLLRVHALQFLVFRIILGIQGGNQYSMPHTRLGSRQAAGEDIIDLSSVPRIPT
jgi:hypothetical protein